MKKILVAIGACLALAACSAPSDTANQNISNDADHYKIFRQIVVYNGFTDKYILEVQGFCSLGNSDSSDEVTYTCREENGRYIKDIIKKSDNTFVFVHQLIPKNTNTAHFQVNFRPSTVIPSVNTGN